MADSALVRSTFQKAVNAAGTGATLGATRYIIPSDVRQIVLKPEFSAAAANGVTASLAVRWEYADGKQAVESGTVTNSDALTSGVTLGSGTHGSLLSFNVRGAAKVYVDVVSGPSSGAIDVWVGGV